MSRWPESEFEPCVTITPVHLEALGAVNGFAGQAVSSFVSTQWPTQNLAIYYPFTVQKPILVRQMFNITGTTSNGDVCIGIYDSAWTKLVTASSTQGTISVVQAFDVTDTVIGPGQFYLALMMSSTTGTFIKGTLGMFAETYALGMAQQVTAGTLPPVATPATMSTANNVVALFGLTTRSVL